MKKYQNILALSTILLGTLSPTASALADTKVSSVTPQSTPETTLSTSGKDEKTKESSSSTKTDSVKASNDLSSEVLTSSTIKQSPKNSQIKEQAIVKKSTTETPKVKAGVGATFSETFPDPILAESVATQLGKSVTDTISSEDLKGSNGGFNLNEKGITKLEGIQYFTDLTYIYANDNSISDLTPLASLGKLVDFRANNNPISDISPLSKCLILQILYLNNTKVSNVTDLSGLAHLLMVGFSGTNIIDWSPLQTLPVLRDLDVVNDRISDIRPFLNLPTLKHLNLSSNPINNFSQLSALTNLTYLSLKDTGISDPDLNTISSLNALISLDLTDNSLSSISPLQNLTSLHNLYLANNNISDITPLSNLSGLNILDLDNNHIIDLTPLVNLKGYSSIKADNQTYTAESIVFEDPLSISNIIKNSDGSLAQITNLRNSGTNGVYKDGILTWQNFTQPLSELTYSWSTNYSNTTIEFSGTVTQPLHENLTKVDVHDSTIYVGDNWKAEDNFDSALDKDGNTVDFTKVTVDDSKVDTSKAGTYDVTYTYDGVTSTAKVTVKAKQTAVNVHDSTIYVGDNWKAEDNFDSALDKDGNTVAFTKVTVDDSKVDTSKAGTYDVTYTYDGVTSTAKVTVKAKQTAVNVHDSTIYVGDNWKAEDNFDSALDKDGNTVAFTKVTVDDSKVDTSKAGTYDVTYTYDGVTSTAKVTVKAKQKPTPKPDQPTDNGKTEKTTVDSKRNESKKDNSKMNMLPETGETSGVIFSLIGILILGLLSIALLFKNKVLKK